MGPNINSHSGASRLPITKSKDENTEQLEPRGHDPIIQMSYLSERLLAGHHTGNGCTSSLPKTMLLVGNRQEQRYGSRRPSSEARIRTGLQSSVYLRVLPPQLLGGTDTSTAQSLELPDLGEENNMT